MHPKVFSSLVSLRSYFKRECCMPSCSSKSSILFSILTACFLRFLLSCCALDKSSICCLAILCSSIAISPLKFCVRLSLSSKSFLSCISVVTSSALCLDLRLKISLILSFTSCNLSGFTSIPSALLLISLATSCISISTELMRSVRFSVREDF